MALPNSRRWFGLVLTCCAMIAGAVTFARRHSVMEQGTVAVESRDDSDESDELPLPTTRSFCASCHAFPRPGSFPKRAWREHVENGFAFAKSTGMNPDAMPAMEPIVRYFEAHAPGSLSVPARPIMQQAENSLRFRKLGLNAPTLPPWPGVSNVHWLQLDGSGPPDLVACDMRYGHVLVRHAGQTNRNLAVIAKLANPAHAEIVDLDRDGWLDLIVADLGSFLPTDDRNGRVIWLQRIPHSDSYKTVVLAEDLGRVADVQAADFDGDGDIDLVVAVFGYHANGQVLYLENRTTDYSQPEFVPHTIEERTGAIHIPVIDLNHDGLPDFVVLFGQEHEQIVAYLNSGSGQFRRETIYAAPDPAYGSSGIQLIDFDGDGDIDVLYTNGDTLDSKYIKPYHGIQWLENEGKFPFRHHPLASLPGVHRAVAADMDRDGDLDIVAVTFLSNVRFPQRSELRLDAVVWLEQTSPGQFLMHTLEQSTCDHVTVDVADWNGDGLPDLAIGNLSLDAIDGPAQFPPPDDWITIWENSSEPRSLTP